MLLSEIRMPRKPVIAMLLTAPGKQTAKIFFRMVHQTITLINFSNKK
jgi:hypothetical protein